jgi:hypothetical protein
MVAMVVNVDVILLLQLQKMITVRFLLRYVLTLIGVVNINEGQTNAS